MLLTAATYAGLIALVTWQALRGQDAQPSTSRLLAASVHGLMMRARVFDDRYTYLRAVLLSHSGIGYLVFHRDPGEVVTRTDYLLDGAALVLSIVRARWSFAGARASLLGFDFGRECGSLGLMPTEKSGAVGTPRDLLVRRHLGSVNFGLDIRVGIEECSEQQTHLPAVPAVELDAPRVHRPHVSVTFSQNANWSNTTKALVFAHVLIPPSSSGPRVSIGLL